MLRMVNHFAHISVSSSTGRLKRSMERTEAGKEVLEISGWRRSFGVEEFKSS
jgi:hypothetical protein